MAGCASPAGTVGVVAVGNLASNARRSPPSIMALDIPVFRAASGSSSLSLARPLAIPVLPFDNVQPDTDIEGRTGAAFGVPLASIRFDPGAATLMGQLARSELLAAGHTVVDRAQNSAITGTVRAFEILFPFMPLPTCPAKPAPRAASC